MKLLLLRVLLQRRAKDEGFTLPIVIALGLIMILLGAVNIMTAGEENINTVSDNQKKKALAIADIGVSRYRQLLDKNRMLMVYDSDDWNTTLPGGERLVKTCDINDVIDDAADPTKWQEVKVGTEKIGEYRLISYIYDIDGDLEDSTDTLPGNDDDGLFAPNDDNLNFRNSPNPFDPEDRDSLPDIHTFNDANYDPKGILTIQSKATDGSKAQVQVQIPLRINVNDMTNIAPALWIGNSNIADSTFDNIIIDGNRNGVADGSATANGDDGNIVISKPASGATPGCDVPKTINGNRVVYDPRPLPKIIPAPSSADLINATEINGKDIPGDFPASHTSSPNDRYVEVRGEDNLSEEMLLLGAREKTPPPTTLLHKIWGTNENNIKYFYYSAPSGISIDDGEKLAVDGNSRAIIYVDGDIDLNDNASLQAGSNSSTSFRSTGLQVYVASGNNITINPGAGNTVVIKGLIHAPDSTVNITGAGTVRIEGAMWVKDLVNTGNADIVIIPDDAPSNRGKAYQHYIGTDLRAAKPITDAVTEWEIQEVEDLPATTTSGTEGGEGQ